MGASFAELPGQLGGRAPQASASRHAGRESRPSRDQQPTWIHALADGNMCQKLVQHKAGLDERSLASRCKACAAKSRMAAVLGKNAILSLWSLGHSCRTGLHTPRADKRTTQDISSCPLTKPCDSGSFLHKALNDGVYLHAKRLRYHWQVL